MPEGQQKWKEEEGPTVVDQQRNCNFALHIQRGVCQETHIERSHAESQK